MRSAFLVGVLSLVLAFPAFAGDPDVPTREKTTVATVIKKPAVSPFGIGCDWLERSRGQCGWCVVWCLIERIMEDTDP